jgi:hypothetical protein
LNGSNGEVVLEGIIETFDLEGYATGTRCYAFPFVRGDKMDIKIVLGLPSVDSPHKALRAALAASERSKTIDSPK